MIKVVLWKGNHQQKQNKQHISAKKSIQN